MCLGIPGQVVEIVDGFAGQLALVDVEFLADAVGVTDPLDPVVVSAYWVGDSLPYSGFSDLLAFLRPRFAGQRGGTWESAGGRALPHHSFHVFEVYPWASLLRRTGNPSAVSVLDRCRIRTGKIVQVRAETATVTTRPLIWDGAALAAGPPHEERVAWSAGGHTLLNGLSPGDCVTLHWDWVCDKITASQAARIETLEKQQLGALFGKSVVPPD